MNSFRSLCFILMCFSGISQASEHIPCKEQKSTDIEKEKLREDVRRLDEGEYITRYKEKFSAFNRANLPDLDLWLFSDRKIAMFFFDWEIIIVLYAVRVDPDHVDCSYENPFDYMTHAGQLLRRYLSTRKLESMEARDFLKAKLVALVLAIKHGNDEAIWLNEGSDFIDLILPGEFSFLELKKAEADFLRAIDFDISPTFRNMSEEVDELCHPENEPIKTYPMKRRYPIVPKKEKGFFEEMLCCTLF